MRTKGAKLQPARMSNRVAHSGEYETRDFALARDKRRKANKAARVARRKSRHH
jgi:hypothetical protein